MHARARAPSRIDTTKQASAQFAQHFPTYPPAYLAATTDRAFLLLNLRQRRTVTPKKTESPSARRPRAALPAMTAVLPQHERVQTLCLVIICLIMASVAQLLH